MQITNSTKPKKPQKVKRKKKLKPGSVDGRPVKYTLQWAMTEVKWMLNHIKNEDDGKSVLFMEELCEKRDYAKNRWSETCSKYSDLSRKEGETDTEFAKRKSEQESFIDYLARVKTLLHNRVLKGGLVKKFDSRLTQFLLINNYGYKSDISETDVTSKGNELRNFTIEVVRPKRNRQDDEN